MWSSRVERAALVGRRVLVVAGVVVALLPWLLGAVLGLVVRAGKLAAAAMVEGYLDGRGGRS